jgi:protein-disulfide isomerase
MAKKSAKAQDRGAATARQAKIQAAQKSAGGGANKIVVATVVAIVAIIATVGGVVWSQMSKENDVTGGGNALPAGVSELGEGYPAFQDVTPVDGAPTVDLYVDYQCPACAMFEQAFGPTLSEQAADGKIKLVYHVKNFLDDNLRNDSSTRSANGAFCASDAGKFQEYSDQLFPGQPEREGDGWTDAQLKAFAETAGLSGADLTTWESCVAAGKYTDYVNSVEKQSFADGVKGTPTVKVNGEDLDTGTLVNAEGTAFDPTKLVAALEAAGK